MKNKIIISFILSCVLIFINSICFASEIEMNTNDELKENTNITINVSINLPEIDEQVNFLYGQLDYDQDIFEKVTTEDITLLNGWYGLVFNSENGKFVIENNSNIEKDIEEVMSIKFKSKNNIDDKTTTIQIKDLKEIGENEVENQLLNSILKIDVIKTNQQENLSNSILPSTGTNSLVIYVIIILCIIALISAILIIKKNKFSR